MLTGVGVGLRACHYAHIQEKKPNIPWFEVLADNYFCESGIALSHLNTITKDYPIALHCVGMSLGSSDPINWDYFKKLKRLASQTAALSISDHLAWTSLNGNYFHELLPLPYTEEAVMHVAKRIREIQDFLETQILIENVSTYLRYNHSTLKEWEFLQAVVDTADACILLDINNIYVSASNNQFNASDYIKNLSPKRVKQFHLGGFEIKENFLLDSHSAPIHEPVWDLFKLAVQHFKALPTSIEWDNQIPDFNRLQEEANKAKSILHERANA